MEHTYTFCYLPILRGSVPCFPVKASGRSPGNHHSLPPHMHSCMCSSGGCEEEGRWGVRAPEPPCELWDRESRDTMEGCPGLP